MLALLLNFEATTKNRLRKLFFLLYFFWRYMSLILSLVSCEHMLLNTNFLLKYVFIKRIILRVRGIHQFDHPLVLACTSDQAQIIGILTMRADVSLV